MLAKQAALAVNDRARAKGLWNAGPQEASVVAIGDEADFLAFRLVGRHEPELASLVPDGGLGQVPDGKSSRHQLILRERPEEVRLVLVKVAATPQQVPARARIAGHP